MFEVDANKSNSQRLLVSANFLIIDRLKNVVDMLVYYYG